MAADLTAARDGLATVLEGVTDGTVSLRVYRWMPGQIQPTAAVITTGVPFVERHQSMGRGLATVRWFVDVAVRMSNLEQAQQDLDRWVGLVTDALWVDSTLGGTVGDTTVDTVDAYQQGSAGSAEVMFARLTVRCLMEDR